MTAQRVLVAEPVGDSGVDLLQVAGFDVDLGIGWPRKQLAERIADYEGILIRSATKLDAELIGRATNLRVVARAGVGIDNIDVAAATKRGIIVANAPRSNIVTAAEHTMALMLALCRNVPQAHASLTAGKWERKRFGGIEVYRKTLGVLGFGRIGQLVAERAKGFDMRVLAFDPFVSAERYRELGVEKAEASADVYAEADIITIHLPNTPETRNWLDAEAFAQTGHARYAEVARGVFDFVLREMTSHDGAFYTAFDAEVDAREGLSYLWTKEEVEQVLGAGEDTALFTRVYGLDMGPNFADPHHSGGVPEANILFLPRP
ncbi:MAG: phosphoglycerate dehydrogenase, partial [Actinobacteria bacterium]|nr:phosphoglycerate dehydrogenase [Actinomycetota bacterium]